MLKHNVQRVSDSFMPYLAAKGFAAAFRLFYNILIPKG